MEERPMRLFMSMGPVRRGKTHLTSTTVSSSPPDCPSMIEVGRVRTRPLLEVVDDAKAMTVVPGGGTPDEVIGVELIGDMFEVDVTEDDVEENEDIIDGNEYGAEVEIMMLPNVRDFGERLYSGHDYEVARDVEIGAVETAAVTVIVVVTPLGGQAPTAAIVRLSIAT